jgi:hypothetical protein
MTPSELKYNVEQTGSHFFDRSSMRFFGDTIRNYGVRQATVNGIEAWELYRKRPVKHGLRKSAYFDCKTFERIFNRD